MEPKVKMSKGNSKLPDVFVQPRNIGVRERQRKNTQRALNEKQKVNTQHKQIINNDTEIKKQPSNPNKKKSRNPFLPMRQWLKLSKQMDAKINEVRQGLQLDKFSKLNFESNPDILNREQHKENKIKYEDCLTLNIMKKTQTSCLKKILHVPTLTVYFLRQSLIDFSVDKNDLQDWIKKCNASVSQRQNYNSPQKIIQLYWNIPQSYYSLIYQYSDGVLFDAILQNTSIFPLQFIQKMALTHLKSDLQIYNSLLIINRNSQSDLKYLPVYQQVDDIIPQFRTFRQLLKINSLQQNQDIKRIQQKMVARLGFLILITYFSGTLVDQDFNNILFESKDCCLFHKQINDPTSLFKIFFDTNVHSQSQKDILSDLLCKILKFKPQQRATFSQISRHKFFKTKFNKQICKMSQIILMLESPGSSYSSKNSSKQLSIHKMTKILQGMQLILRGASDIEKSTINLSSSNSNIKYILYQLGLGSNQTQLKSYTPQIVNKLKKIYDI